MPFDKFDLETITEERIKSIKQTIHSVSVDEVKKMGEQLFKLADDPWRNAFFSFIAEHPSATYHHAVTHDQVNILYCQESDRGIWFLPGSGLGPLQANGKKAMSDAIGSLH